MNTFKTHKLAGFTIVEVAIVVVVITILAALTVVVYNGVQARAQETSVKSNLDTAATELRHDKLKLGTFPVTLQEANGGRGVGGTDTVDYTYASDGTSFCLTGVSKANAGIIFSVNHNGTITQGTTCADDDIEDVIEEEEGGGGGGGGGGTTPEACFAFTAGTKTITNYYNNENNNGSNPACPRAVNIPGTIGGVVVENIGNYAFSTKSLTAVTLPSSIKWIGYESFGYNSIGAIAFPSGLQYISEFAFASNALTSATGFPVSLIEIGQYAFEGNELTSVSISSGTQLIGFGVFDATVTVNYY